MDAIVDINQFPILRQSLTDRAVRRSIRLLTVFGVKGSQVIYVTAEDDRVFAFGNNRNGCLGVGHGPDHNHIEIPILNTELSGKQLVAFAHGFEHCLALTSSGKCWSWGQNKYGQLGIGHNVPALTPELVQQMEDQVVIQIRCGCSHNLVLTNSGQVFAWGSNTFGQLGDRSYDASAEPIQVAIPGRVVSISCGKNHSIALTSDGLVYAWGLNESGQLGRHPDTDIRKGRDKRSSFRPELIESLSKLKFSKVVCGPNHTQVLTTDGVIYGFGDNSYGQIGNGQTGAVVMPFKMANGPRIKDVISHYENDLSIAVSADNKCYLWGLADSKPLLNPRLITDRLSAYSLLDIYAKYAKHKVTFKNVVVAQDIETEEQMIIEEFLKESIAQKNYNKTDSDKLFESFAPTGDHLYNRRLFGVNDLNQMRRSEHKINGYQKKDFNYNITNDENDYNFSEMDNSVIYSIVADIVADDGDQVARNQLLLPKQEVAKHEHNHNHEKTIANLFLSRLRESFNNKTNFDLKIIIGKKIIYCHKTILEIRNKKFWNILRQRLTDGSKGEVRVEPQCYVAFFAFVQYLYGFEPNLDDRIVFVLHSLAKAYVEPELEQMCSKFIGGLADSLSVDNVCALYEKAFNQGLKDLEQSCISFASDNWKAVMRSEAFQKMQNTLTTELMFAIFDNE